MASLFFSAAGVLSILGSVISLGLTYVGSQGRELGADPNRGMLFAAMVARGSAER